MYTYTSLSLYKYMYTCLYIYIFNIYMLYMCVKIGPERRVPWMGCCVAFAVRL